MFDLRRRGKVSDVVMAGTNGGKVCFPVTLRPEDGLTIVVSRDPGALPKEHWRRLQGLGPDFPRFPRGQLAQCRSL
jgi:hypothetical protein